MSWAEQWTNTARVKGSIPIRVTHSKNKGLGMLQTKCLLDRLTASELPFSTLESDVTTIWQSRPLYTFISPFPFFTQVFPSLFFERGLSEIGLFHCRNLSTHKLNLLEIVGQRTSVLPCLATGFWKHVIEKATAGQMLSFVQFVLPIVLHYKKVLAYVHT